MIKRLKDFLQSFYLVPTIFIVGFLCWLFNLTLLGIGVMAVIVALILLLCKDVKNIFAIILYCGYFINDIMEDPNWLLYGICIAVAVISFIVFIIRSFVTLKNSGKKLNFGKLTPSICIMDVGFLLAGLIGNFNFIAFIITLGFNVTILLLYLIAINSTENLLEFLFKTFIVGGVYLAMELFATNVKNGSWDKIFTATSVFIGAVNVNTLALMLVLGIVGCFTLSVKNEKSTFQYMGLAFLFAFAIIVSKCRMAMGISFVCFIFGFVYCIKRVGNIWTYVIAYVVYTLTIAVLIYVFRDIETGIAEKIKTGTNGRTDLWSWCIERFKEHPVFGYGFIGDEVCPTIREGSKYFALAHNTVLQWFTSMGVIGALFTVPFYVTKYKLLVKARNAQTFAVVCVLAIALAGMVDQSPSMDPFIFMLPLLIMAGIEKEQ